MEILWILAIPLIGGLLLALFGCQRFAPELNSIMSFGTFVASAFLTVRVITDGPITALNEESSSPSTRAGGMQTGGSFCGTTVKATTRLAVLKPSETEKVAESVPFQLALGTKYSVSPVTVAPAVTTVVRPASAYSVPLAGRLLIV